MTGSTSTDEHLLGLRPGPDSVGAFVNYNPVSTDLIVFLISFALVEKQTV